jgi:hypothetical protein
MDWATFWATYLQTHLAALSNGHTLLEILQTLNKYVFIGPRQKV